jgi:hypothetical protein
MEPSVRLTPASCPRKDRRDRRAVECAYRRPRGIHRSRSLSGWADRSLKRPTSGLVAAVSRLQGECLARMRAQALCSSCTSSTQKIWTTCSIGSATPNRLCRPSLRRSSHTAREPSRSPTRGDTDGASGMVRPIRRMKRATAKPPNEPRMPRAATDPSPWLRLAKDPSPGTRAWTPSVLLAPTVFAEPA